MKIMQKAFAFVLASVAVAATAADQAFVCRHNDSIREIHVIYENPGQPLPCSVLYRKAEGEQTLWSAQAQVGYCEEKAAAFVAKQQSWGWDCAAQTQSQEDSGDTSAAEVEAVDAVEQPVAPAAEPPAS